MRTRFSSRGSARALGMLGLVVTRLALSSGEPAPGAVNATTVKLPDGPGSVRGLSDAANVGVFAAQVSYSVPIDLPKGHGGLSPSLALSYSGDLGNGPVGVGWTLPVASIRRSTRFGVPKFEDSDDLELVGIAGGGRLVLTTHGWWALENRGRAVKVEKTTLSTGEKGFRVTENGGVVYELGASAQSRQAEGARVTAWFAERVIHPTGATIEMRYLRDGGQLYLERIEWGPANPGDLENPTRYRVQLDYGLPQDRPDHSVSLRSGVRVQTNLRLKEIVVHAAGEIARAYVLDYGTVSGLDERWSLSRLQGVRMLGRGRQGELPPLSFEYAQPLPPTVTQLDGVGGWVLNQDGVSLADVDGDGMSDLLRLGVESDSWRQGLGTGFGAERVIHGAEYAWLEDARLVDIDGDARPELLQNFSGSLQVSRLEEDGFGPPRRGRVQHTFPCCAEM